MTMIEAPEEPRVYWSRQHRTWITDSDVIWYDRHSGKYILVAKGYKTDLASVPFFVRPIIATYGSWNRAAIVHDSLYENKGVLPCGKVLSRKECDRIFFDISVADGTEIWQAVVMHRAVRINPLNYPIFKQWGC
jgi:hypothetical protein